MLHYNMYARIFLRKYLTKSCNPCVRPLCAARTGYGLGSTILVSGQKL